MNFVQKEEQGKKTAEITTRSLVDIAFSLESFLFGTAQLNNRLKGLNFGADVQRICFTFVLF